MAASHFHIPLLGALYVVWWGEGARLRPTACKGLMYGRDPALRASLV